MTSFFIFYEINMSYTSPILSENAPLILNCVYYVAAVIANQSCDLFISESRLKGKV